MWFILALAGALLWTGVNLYDKVAVRTIFTRASQGLFISGLFSSCGLIFAIFTGWQMPSIEIFIWSFIGALLLQLSQFFYFQALEREEIDDLVAYGSTYPLVVAFFAIPLGKILLPIHWLGIILVFIGVALIEWKKTSHSLNAKLDIVIYVLGLAASSLVMDEVLDNVQIFEVLIPYSIGLTVGGLLPMIFRSERKELKKVWPKIKKYLPSFGAVEIINVIALLCEVWAIGLGHPALVNTVASAEPVFVVMFTQILSGIPVLNSHFPRAEKIHHKLVIVGIIIIGLVLVTIPH